LIGPTAFVGCLGRWMHETEDGRQGTEDAGARAGPGSRGRGRSSVGDMYRLLAGRIRPRRPPGVR
jgi:hypothetical protein